MAKQYQKVACLQADIQIHIGCIVCIYYTCIYIYTYTYCVYSLPYPHTVPIERARILTTWHGSGTWKISASWRATYHGYITCRRTSHHCLDWSRIPFTIYIYIYICINIQIISYIDMYKYIKIILVILIYIMIYIYTFLYTHTHACSVLPHRPCRCQNQKHWSFLSGVPRKRQDWGTPEGCQSLGSATTCTAPWPTWRG